MTTVTVFFEGKNISGFTVDGHSGFAQAGEDIVCAGISALTFGAVRGLQGHVKIKPVLKKKDGFLSCLLPEELEEKTRWQCNAILQTMFLGLSDLAEQHPDFLKVLKRRCSA